MKTVREHSKKIAVAILFAANFFIWYAVSASERGVLTVAFLDVGQGDAIFVESPTGVQVLIDGGPDNGVLAELGSVIPFFDRSIDMLIVSNPDKDHFAGFVDVLKRYSIKYVLEPGTKTETEIYKTFRNSVDEKGIETMFARRGMIFDLGGGATLEILFPDRDVSGLSTNDGSIVAKLVYGDTSFMFPGDTTEAIEKYLVALDGKNLDVDVLKLAHHGSKTSSSDLFLAATTPEYAIISAGKDNRYGHPHQEVIDRLELQNISTLKTFEKGRVTFKSDGIGITKN